MIGGKPEMNLTRSRKAAEECRVTAPLLCASAALREVVRLTSRFDDCDVEKYNHSNIRHGDAMTFRGHIKNGAVVLDEPVDLPEGMDVEVDVRPAGGEEAPTLYERYRDIIGKAEGLPPDFSVNHDHYIHGTPKRESK